MLARGSPPMSERTCALPFQTPKRLLGSTATVRVTFLNFPSIVKPSSVRYRQVSFHFCNFTQNAASGVSGGAVHVSHGASATFADVHFSSNIAETSPRTTVNQQIPSSTEGGEDTSMSSRDGESILWSGVQGGAVWAGVAAQGTTPGVGHFIRCNFEYNRVVAHSFHHSTSTSECMMNKKCLLARSEASEGSL